MEPVKLPKRHNKKVAVAVIILLTFAVGGVAAWRYGFDNLKDKLPFVEKSKSEETVKATDALRASAKTDEERANIDLANASVYINNKEYDRAEKLLEPYLYTDLSDEKKLSLYGLWGNVLANQDRYDELVEHVDEVLNSKALKAYPDLIPSWQAIKAKAEKRENPFIAPPGDYT